VEARDADAACHEHTQHLNSRVAAEWPHRIDAFIREVSEVRLWTVVDSVHKDGVEDLVRAKPYGLKYDLVRGPFGSRGARRRQFVSITEPSKVARQFRQMQAICGVHAHMA